MRALASFIFFLFVIAPVALGLFYAFMSANGYFAVMPGTTQTTAFYAVISDGGFLRSMGYTLLLAAVVMIASSLIALLVVRVALRHDGPNTLTWKWFIPLGIPPIVAAIASFHLFSDTGLISRVLFKFRLIESSVQFPDLVNDAMGWSVVFTHVFLAFPFFVILFMVSARSAEARGMLDAARSLGANEHERFLKLFTPWVLRKNAAILAVWFIFVLGTYEIPLLLGNQRLRTVTVLIMDKLRGYDLSLIPTAYAMSTIYILLIVLIARIIVESINRPYDA